MLAPRPSSLGVAVRGLRTLAGTTLEMICIGNLRDGDEIIDIDALPHALACDEDGLYQIHVLALPSPAHGRRRHGATEVFGIHTWGLRLTH